MLVELRAHAGVREFLCDARLFLLRGCEVGGTGENVAFHQLGHAPPKQRLRRIRIELERLVVVDDGFIGLAELEIGKPAMVERAGIVRLEPERLVAILQRGLELA